MAPDSADDALAVAVALALTGERLDVTGSAAVGDELARAGFDQSRLRRIRAERQRLHQPWPFAVPVAERGRLGFARFDAALAQAREQLGLTGLESAHPASRPLNRDEQRLSAERPPHW